MWWYDPIDYSSVDNSKGINTAPLEFSLAPHLIDENVSSLIKYETE